MADTGALAHQLAAVGDAAEIPGVGLYHVDRHFAPDRGNGGQIILHVMDARDADIQNGQNGRILALFADI